jgi:hypothetical protein
MLTADTITDEQIRALHDGEKPVSDALHELCRVALNAAVGSLRRAQARGQLADLLNGKDVKIPLNAVTITDEEIRKLMAVTDRDTRKLCEIALRDPHTAKTRGATLMMARRKGEARARLAEILSSSGVFAEILPGRSSK